MKNLLLLSLVVVLFTALTLSSCSSKNNDQGSNSPANSVSGALKGEWTLDAVRCINTEGLAGTEVPAKEAYPDYTLTVFFGSDYVLTTVTMATPAGCVVSSKSTLLEVSSKKFRYKDSKTTCTDACQCQDIPTDAEEKSIEYTINNNRAEVTTDVDPQDTTEYCQKQGAAKEVQIFKK